MILLATNKRDITTDFIVLELQRRELPYVRLNTEDIASGSISLRPAAGQWIFNLNGRLIDLGTVTGAYYRRPGAPEVEHDITDATIRPYRVDEWSAVLRSIWNELEGRWLNSPFAILRAEDKPRQLRLAADIGFTLPDTLITNDPDQAISFSLEGACIAKPLRHALLDDAQGPGRVIFTHRIDALTIEDRNAIHAAPFILQHEIHKRVDIRVIVVGERIFATAIHSQDGAETEVDWRRGSDPSLLHESIELDTATQLNCVAITKALGLRFGAIDLVEDLHGRYWFLEINPNGQWAWIQNRTGAAISEAIVDELCR